ncbi:unc-112-related protein [Drosophila madeirensis]|uniref:Blast:Unc-112-related protein n=2 Tax=obscura subgroup TaxID=32357 RepID=A0A3B0JVW6_DROGU|nr:unc-112-related protein [Drosophila guanche]XP_034133360.1 unc-112-related protein [Drosophila guanche]XP_034656931.1 unc-112-related protein [Drosophila subobscura]XP_034656932.1 unc-112-related protein [Drosophila subobscura]SPP85213.1 blast:Unc-112-related protein [Drosophila guanche]
MIHVGENSWNLRIFITDLSLERTMRVRGDQHIGGIMLQLVDPENPKDWSDHALWWPARNIWLNRTRATLDQCGVQADSLLHFTPMHKILRVQLPDLRYLDCRVDYSVKTFAAVVNLCKQLEIRYPEELSLCKPLEAEHLKKNFAQVAHQKRVPIAEPDGTTYLHPAADTNSFVPINAAFHGDGGSTGSLDKPSAPGMFFCAPLSPHNHSRRSPMASSPAPSPGTWKQSQLGYATYDSSSSSLGDFQENLASSPPTPCADVRAQLLRPKSLVEKARLNVGWLDSSLSIMEQGIREYDTLRLRFKYFTFFDLNPKYDQVRINQLYEQAKWSILNEELDCTEEESLMFAALQFQVNHHVDALPTSAVDSGIETSSQENDDDEIDSALKELQITLEGPNAGGDAGNITRIPELSDYLRYLKPQRFTLRGFKRYFFTYRDLHLHLYKSAEDSRRQAPAISINLKGCEVTPDVNLSQGKYAIRLEVSPEGRNGPNSEVWVRCENEQQYAKWMAACRLAAKGRSLADSSYESEVDSILSLLQMQRPVHGVHVNIDPRSVEPVDYLSPKMNRKLSGKAVQRILEAHANVRELNLLESKLKYIQAWQSLPDFGVTLFIIKFDGHKKEELLGVAQNRIMRMDLSSGDHIKTWRYNNMKAWNVNWNIKCMMIQFQDENVVFSCHSADCKVVHEFIGGYIFMSMRSKDNNQTLNEELFHKLTGGWS